MKAWSRTAVGYWTASAEVRGETAARSVKMDKDMRDRFGLGQIKQLYIIGLVT